MRESIEKNKKNIKKLKQYKSLGYIDEYKLKEFLKENPSNFEGLLDLVTIYREKEEYVEALKILDEILEKYKGIYKKISFGRILLEYALINFSLKKYEECYYNFCDLMQEEPTLFNAKNKNIIFSYLITANKLNKEIDLTAEQIGNVGKWVLNYNSEYAKTGVIKMHDFNLNLEASPEELIKGRTLFASDIDVGLLFEKMREIIALDEVDKDVTKNSLNHLYFKYDNIGSTEKRKNLNYIHVIAIRDTNNIIDMFPCKSPDIYWQKKNREAYDFHELEEKLHQKAL